MATPESNYCQHKVPKHRCMVCVWKEMQTRRVEAENTQEPCTSYGLGRWWKRPLCWLFGHHQRWSPDDADEYCRRCGKLMD